MALSFEERVKIARIYEPHLVLSKQTGVHPFGLSKIGAPVDPASYIRQCALWSDSNADFDEPQRDNWGTFSALAQSNLPTVEAGQLEVDPSAAASQGKMLLSSAMGMLDRPNAFLSMGGWQETWGDQPELNLIQPPAGEVSSSTRNRIADIRYGIMMATDVGVDVDPFANSAPPHYMAEGFDRDDLLAGSSPLADDAANIFGDVDTQMGELGALYFWYHYFFPTHDTLVERCELIALLDTFDIKVEDLPSSFQETFSTAFSPTGFDSSSAFQSAIEALEEAGASPALLFNSFLGDFTSVAVVIPRPAGGSLLDIPDEEFQPPLFVGFGAKQFAYNLISETEFEPVLVPIMSMADASMVDMEGGTHPVVYSALGTNNFHMAPGEPPLPRDPRFTSRCDINFKSNDDDVPSTGKNNRRHDGALTFLKLLAAGATGGLAGTLFGAVRAKAEAERDRNPTILDETFPPNEDKTESVPNAANGFFIRSETTRNEFGDADSHFTYWPSDATNMVINPATPPNWFGIGNLAYGVNCTDDPLRTRRGRAQPTFYSETIQALATTLARG